MDRISSCRGMYSYSYHFFDTSFLLRNSLVLFFLLTISTVSAQIHAPSVTIRSIEINGNTKTKTRLIRLEMDIEEGDLLNMSEWEETKIRNRTLILNTQMFSEVTINDNIEDDFIDIVINVEENRFYSVAPLFDMADRNFNVWWKEFKLSPKRVSIGAKSLFLNPTGVADYATLTLQMGYTRKFEAAYHRPYFNSGSKFGSTWKFLYTTSKQIAFTTSEDKLRFNPGIHDFITDRLELRYSLTWRGSRNVFHEMRFDFKRFRIDESVASLNEGYFEEGLSQKSLDVEYRFRYDKRNYWIYPTSGYLIQASARKVGLGILSDDDHMWLRTDLAYYHRLTQKMNLGWELTVSSEILGRPLAYFNRKAIGYNDDIVRGYETFVIDGNTFAIFKQQFKYHLFNFRLNVRNITQSKLLLDSYPFEVYGTLHSDFGYVKSNVVENNNSLQNGLLVGAGFGIEVVFRYKLVAFSHVSRNREGLTGLYFGIKGLL